MTTAWVFRGGASFAAAQVGMAQALLDAGHYPDMVLGSSAGALNAALVAAEPTEGGVDALARLWERVARSDVFPLNPLVLLAGALGTSDHFVSSKALARWLRATCPLKRLEDSVLPLTITATDVATGEEVLLSSGRAVPALLASAAIPGIFPPVHIGGRWLMDGSVVADSPVGPAVNAGATRVWVLSGGAGGTARTPKSVLGMLLRATSVVVARNHLATLEQWCHRCELYLVPAPVVPGTSPFSFSKSGELIASARELAAEWLKDAQQVGSRAGT